MDDEIVVITGLKGSVEITIDVDVAIVKTILIKYSICLVHILVNDNGTDNVCVVDVNAVARHK